MKNIFLLFAIALSFIACNKPKEPEFLRIEEIKLDKLGLSGADIRAMMVFSNPNDFGLTVAGSDLEVIIDGKKAGTVVQSDEIAVKANSEFKVPVIAKIKQEDLFEDALGSLGKAIDIALSKKMKLKIQGKVFIKVFGKKIPVPVDYTDEVNF